MGARAALMYRATEIAKVLVILGVLAGLSSVMIVMMLAQPRIFTRDGK